MKICFSFLYAVFCVATAMVGYHIHHSVFWAIMDWIFTGFAWCKWLILHEVNLTIIRDTFTFFLK